MSMNRFLAEFYGTDGSAKTAAAATEDTEKMASVNLFMKLAADQSIDLSAMQQEEVNELYARWVKESSAPEEEAEEKKKLKEKAEHEHEEKKAQSEKIAEADFLGRVMAHSMAAELREINKVAAAGGVLSPPVRMKTAEEEQEEKEKHNKEHPPERKDGKDGKGEHEHGHMPPAFAAHMKNASATEQLAVEYAYELAKAAGFDPAEAILKVASALYLGLTRPGEKSASAPTVDAAVSTRALELLEQVGYPVTWN